MFILLSEEEEDPLIVDSYLTNINKTDHRNVGSLSKFMKNVGDYLPNKRTDFIGLPDSIKYNRKMQSQDVHDEEYIDDGSDVESVDDQDSSSDYCSDGESTDTDADMSDE